MDPDLEQALQEMEFAMEEASATIERQLENLDEGLYEEDEGDSTQAGPGPKVDRVAEISQKLQQLEADAEEAAARDHIVTAREYVQSYLKSHPEGGH